MIAILIFPLVDNRGNMLSTLSITIGKGEMLAYRDIILREFSEPIVRYLTIKTLRALYDELKNPPKM